MIRNGKILLQRPKNDDYSIIGGHVAAMETSIETLKREFEEELHTKIEVDNLLAIGEIYFPWGKRPCHQICLYYLSKYGNLFRYSDAVMGVPSVA